MDRRRFMQIAGAMGATALLRGSHVWASTVEWTERRDLFPEGVASGDPQDTSVILWTRQPHPRGSAASRLLVEVAEDREFRRVVASTWTPILETSDWTARVLVGRLRPATEYWYRFSDEQGRGSRIGRTLTAPDASDPRSVRFAFVSCQDLNTGAIHAYRRMIHEDERAAPDERIQFVLHLGDFIYEQIWYPEDLPRYLSRAVRELVRYPDGQKIGNFHVPTTVDDYRLAYQAYLHDADLQDARARFPFVCIWDNHEFSGNGWQSMLQLGPEPEASPSRKVAANQAWFEYQPARIAKPDGALLERFEAPPVQDTPITEFDDDGLGLEPNNLAAIRSLTGYRALRFGRNVDLLITDQRSFRSNPAANDPASAPFFDRAFNNISPQESLEMMDAGRAYNDGQPPRSLPLGDAQVPNVWHDRPPQTNLGAEQRRWFLDALSSSQAVWKIWGNSLGTLEWRTDPQNLPEGMTKPWPGAGYGILYSGDWATTFTERRQIYDLVRERGITGFAVVSGDRHSFWAGLASAQLPPAQFDPVGVVFITGSISSAGYFEAMENRMRADAPLRPLFLGDQPDRPEPVVNLLLRHGVRACLEYLRTRDLDAARALSNRELSPHLSFLDLGGHGYSVVTASPDAIVSEFVCIPRPVAPIEDADGGPVSYRVRFRANAWQPNQAPNLVTEVVEGDPRFSL